ncbi:MAG: response regulator [Candidatus Omnitrophica bacterium]|nr:response regulator [Candidatus Omnitrophota bacterium]
MNKKKILLVDDEEDMLYAVRLQLEAGGFDVLTACDGQEGLNLARRENPDLIILDVMLPKVDGYKVCRMLKFDRKYNTIPIIMFTARVQEGDQQTGYEVGADAYMAKPFEPRKLLDKINELLKQKQSLS